MEKPNNENKKDKQGPDGLTKKERRALKVNARPSQTNQAAGEHAQKPLTNTNAQPGDTIVQTQTPVVNSKSLTEKELRRLEWAKKLEQEKKSNEGDKNLSKAEMKAKRREKQEAQRQQKSEQVKTNVSAEKCEPVTIKEIIKKPSSNKKVITPKKKHKVTEPHVVQLVQHLYNEDSLKQEDTLMILHHDIHPAFVRLGVQYSSKVILGSNARCLALLAALKLLVNDLKSPQKQEFCRYLENVLQVSTNYLNKCRPFAVSMTNALRYFKLQLTQIDTNLKDIEKKAKLQDIIDTYIDDDISKAGVAISMKVREKISNGDVILTYGCSSLIRKILLEAHADGKVFEVIIVDSRPLLEGKELLRRLVVAGVKCTYVLINSLSYIMNSVTKVLLGAHALLTNGYVMSRIGTAQVALVAREYNKPVLVCCETYKFSERVQTDSFVYNEVGNPDALSTTHRNDITPLSNWKDSLNLTPLSLLYDVTPPDFVTAVVTEIAILPCTSVPVVLRINASETT
ncbi:unnamed protein product [Phyllotreta striolata]|uniref:Translation initiation factor eIF2B subunit delta n=1 Tax=Phyllotreta striolata TaxID=444603 RepID=A0A9N9XR30_PHYSR|nr:unnamed protein product [Phyllotreta striolata]